MTGIGQYKGEGGCAPVGSIVRISRTAQWRLSKVPFWGTPSTSGDFIYAPKQEELLGLLLDVCVFQSLGWTVGSPGAWYFCYYVYCPTLHAVWAQTVELVSLPPGIDTWDGFQRSADRLRAFQLENRLKMQP